MTHRKLIEQMLEALEWLHALDEENHQRYSGDEDVCKEVQQARVAITAAREYLAAPEVEPQTDSYIQRVPDKCDSIIWRNRYYHLPITHPAPEAKQPVNQQLLEALERIADPRNIHFAGDAQVVARAAIAAAEQAQGAKT